MTGLGGFFLLLAALPTVFATADLSGIYSLVQRRIPQHADSFTFSLVNDTGDSFWLSDTPGQDGVSINCTTTSACARGLHTYCTEFGGVDIFWTGSRLDQLPTPLPKVGEMVNGTAIVPWRYMFNTVTFGYTTAFWNFTKWELLLDWMAMRGVNLPLSWLGYESLLIDVYHEVGLSDDEIFDFLAGPPSLPWNRFGNMQGSWGGRLPMQWVEDQFALQKQLLPRMLELGMTPILPAYTGFVPSAMPSHFPNSSFVNGETWNNFPLANTNDTFLEPFDPLFPQMQKSFITKQQAAYGNISHFYTLDQYNENNPFSGNLSYLSSIGSSTVSSLRAADPEAIWVLQGWLFFSSETFWTNDRIEAYLGSVANDSMLILDLYSEAQPQWNRTQSYFGKPWVWCELHDYGGNMGMEGNLQSITQGPISALHTNGSTMAGMGLTMEGMELGNELVYDVLLDQAWSPVPINFTEYAKNWATRRYMIQQLPPDAAEAWDILATTVYNNSDPDSQAAIKSIFELSPATTGLINVTGHHPTKLPYETNTTVLKALNLLVNTSQSSPWLTTVPEFMFDLTELTRQLVAGRFVDMYTSFIDTWNTTNSGPQDVANAGMPLVNILQDLDDLLFTNENFLLSTWIADAKQWANGNASYEAFLEYTARTQLTLWGPTGEINDYASKQWAGITGEYYANRWQTFISTLVSTKTQGLAYNATANQQTLLNLGELWVWNHWGTGKGEVWGTKGDNMAAIMNILNKWT